MAPKKKPFDQEDTEAEEIDVLTSEEAKAGDDLSQWARSDRAARRGGQVVEEDLSKTKPLWRRG